MNLNSLDYMIMNPGIFGMGFSVTTSEVWILSLDYEPGVGVEGIWIDEHTWNDANLWLD